MNMSTLQINALRSKLVDEKILGAEGAKPPIIDKTSILKKR